MLKSHVKTAPTRRGEMSYYVDDYYIGASLKLYGEYSELETDFLHRIIEPGWAVVDAGANIGVLTLAFAEMVGSEGKVHAFEPQPENYQLLERNTAHMANIEAHDVALGDHEGCIIAPPLSTLQHRNYGRVELGGDFGDTVRLTKLDTILMTEDSADNRDIVDLIKIDVEGMEVEVLKGAIEIIKLNRPILYVENDRSERSRELLELLQSWGYECFAHNPPVYNRANFNKAPRDAKFEYGSLNVLAIPKDVVDKYAHVVAELRPSKPAGPKRRVDSKAWAGLARMGGVGDNLIAASVCKPLKDLGYLVEVISQDPCASLFENNPHIDKLSVYQKDDWPQDQMQWQKWFAARGKEYDRFANLSHSIEVLHAVFPHMTAFWWPQEFRRQMLGGSYLESTHALLGLTAPYTFGRLFWPTDEETERALEVKAKLQADRPVVGWCCNGTRIDKVYPQAPQTIGRLIKELGVQVVLLGRGPGHADYTLAKQTEEMVRQQNGDTNGLGHIDGSKWSLRTSLAFCQLCDLMIGPDTGPMWAVAMEPTPKIMLHGHASVENITKHWVNTVSLHADPVKVRCFSCHRLHDDASTCVLNEFQNGAACISSISADLLVTAAKAALGCQSSRATMLKDWSSNVTLPESLVAKAT